MKARSWLVLLGLVAIVSCAPPPAEEPMVDLEAERTALMDTDEAWSQTVGSVDTFVSFVADDASFLPFGAPLAQGREAIRTTFEGLSSMPGFNLEWQATSAEVAEAGDLGYTLGTFELTIEQEGTPMVTVGKYVTVWKKQADGSWKVVVDCFNADGPPTEG